MRRGFDDTPLRAELNDDPACRRRLLSRRSVISARVIHFLRCRRRVPVDDGVCRHAARGAGPAQVPWPFARASTQARTSDSNQAMRFGEICRRLGNVPARSIRQRVTRARLVISRHSGSPMNRSGMLVSPAETRQRTPHWKETYEAGARLNRRHKLLGC